MFSFAIAELATSNNPALKYWHSHFVEALTAARVDEKFCIKLMCQHSQSMEIGELLADTLSQYILIRRPNELKFDIPVHVPSPVRQLGLFLREVGRYHKGWLLLQLQHSYFHYVPCENLIEALTGAR